MSARTEELEASPAIFQSRALDRLTRVHPLVPVFIFLPAIAAFASAGITDLGVTEGLLGVAAGYGVWTFSEYWIHRALFHFEPKGGIGARLHWMIHGVHHDHPNDPNRLVMPPLVPFRSAPRSSSPSTRSSGCGRGRRSSAGFFTRYLAYDMLHFALHHGSGESASASVSTSCTCATTSENDRYGFAISAPWSDIVFRDVLRPRARRRA